MQTIFEIVCIIKIIVVYLYQQKNNNDMTIQEINQFRNERGNFLASNETAGWEAISRDGIHMITFASGKSKIYTEKGFARVITRLLNRGY